MLSMANKAESNKLLSDLISALVKDDLAKEILNNHSTTEFFSIIMGVLRVSWVCKLVSGVRELFGV